MDSKKLSAGTGGSGGVIPVKVAVRIRPISNKETEEGCQSVVSVVPDRPQIFLSSVDKAFTFDFAFPANTPQKDVYTEAIEGMIPQLFEGYNATVLAYGQTGSGKTHSMGTSHGPEDDPEMAGIIQRTVQDLFKEIQARSDQIEVKVRVSFVELYREQLYDLLSTKSNKKEECICDLREDPVKGVVILNLTETAVTSLAGTMHQLELGSNKRVTAATAMNNTSSRSHAIFTLFLDIVNKMDGGNSRVAKFHLVDLAGSERANKTKATGDRMKEGVAINRGLLALGNVISALGESNSGHVPYRDSKLTRMLQDSLGGNSYTLMLSCVSPADSNVEETIGTLRYADRARKIKNKPIVNLNGNEMEVNRLRMENQELRLQLLQGGVSSLGGISSTEADDLRQENKRVKEENKELIKALVACQDEFAHMNEKMMLQDASAEKLKTKFKELLAELDVMIAKPEGSGRNELQDFKKKVSEVVEIQHNAEQTIMDHEISRADVSQRVPTDEEKIGRGNDDGDDDDDDDDGSDDGDETTFDATHALKQNALATQLNELNKVLAQKEKLATAMYSNDEKLQEMKAKYENNVLTMEKQISTMLKEKDELFQQHKNTPNNDPANKIAEQRRKRIQELEQMITDLRKKVTEQQRAIKVNEKNAAQVKKLADEIQGMKAQKVKLIRQIKEDAEKVRVWKQQKEKEVMKLKQQERKAQVKMAKMETLHSKQQNVLRRKMEEAIVLNKRLKDVVDKQKASRAANAGKVHGLAGAGDRMRNWINEQMEVVVSVKEATQSREELMNDRKTLTKQLNDIKKSMRDTMTNEDMKALAIKTKELQDDLDLRNAQISNLQKQITDLEQDGRDNVSGAKKNRFEAVRSMTEAKIALEHLFEKNIEQTFNVTQMKSEFTELRHLYEEAVKNTNTLENEIAVLKNEHQSEFLRASREHEEKVLYLLSKLNDTNEGERLKVHELEINKFNKLHDELLKLSEDNEKLRQQVLTKGGDEKKEGNISKVKIEKPPPVKKVITYEDETDEDSIAEEDSDDENDRDDDPDWRKTPLFKRIKKLRETGGGSTFLAPPAQKLKRKISSDAEGGDDDEENGSTKPKRTSKSSGTSGCRCKEGCKTKRCRCKKNSGTCDTSCGCDPSQCKNRPGEAGNDTTGGDRSSLSDISNNDTANTMSLLNDTYTSGIVGSPSKKGRPSFFKSPITPEYEKSTLHPTKFNFSPSPN